MTTQHSFNSHFRG